MKRNIVLILILAVLASLVPIAPFEAKAESVGDKIETEIFLPTSYLQYYKLDAPHAICRFSDGSNEFVAISHEGGIVVYNKNGETGAERFNEIELAGAAVPCVAKFGNYLLYTRKSKIFAVDVSNFDDLGEEVETPLACSSSFSVCGRRIATATSTGIFYYDMEVGADGISFVEVPALEYQNSDVKCVLNSKNGKTYFAALSAEDGYVVAEYDPINGGEPRTIVRNLTDVRSMAESASDGDDNIYFTTDKGVFAVSSSDYSLATICEIETDITEDKDLGKLWSPRGICLTDNCLWVVDKGICAAQEIDLRTKEFTQFAITTNSQAVNRLSAAASDIVMDGDKIYALDGNRIVVVNDINGDDRTYNRIDLRSASIDKFAVGGGYVLLTRDNDVELLKLDSPSDETPIISYERIDDLRVDLDGGVIPNAIDDVCYADGKFYLLGSRSTGFADRQRRPVVYEIDASGDEYSLSEIAAIDLKGATACEITRDAFGTIYIAVSIADGYEFYKFENKNLKKVGQLATSEKALNLQTDLDGNLYLLLENDKVARISENGESTDIVTKTLSTSNNLGDASSARSMCLSLDSENAYFIFGGFILRSSNADDLNASTPYAIKIPDGFNYRYDSDVKIRKIREGAKLFKINASAEGGEFFAFERFENENGLDEYATKDLGGKYLLAVKDGVAALVRKVDAIDEREVETFSTTLYAAVDFSLYSLPALNGAYKSDGERILKYDRINVEGKLDFNGEEFYLVERGDEFGFIPSSFLTSEFSAQDEYSSIANAYVYTKGGTLVYSDSELLNQIGVIDGNKKTYVLSRENGSVKILYDGRVGFVAESAVADTSRRNLVKAAAVVALAASMFATAMFFCRKYLFNE